MKTMTFARYIHNVMRPYRIGVPLVFSLVSGLVVMICIVVFRANSDYHLVRAVSPHLSTLLETHDRPEAMRLLGSISRERNVELLVLQGHQIFATSRATSELDTDFTYPVALVELEKSQITRRDILTSAPIERVGGPRANAKILILTLTGREFCYHLQC